MLDDGTEHKIETIDSCGDDVLIELYNGREKDTVRDMIAEEELKKLCIAYMPGYVVQCSLPKTVNLIHYLTMKTIRIIDVVKLFPGLNDHLLNQSPTCDENHVMSITKLVIGRYFKVRCLSYVKLINQRHNPETSKRNELLKLLHVKGM